MKTARTKRPAKGSPPVPAAATLSRKKKPAAGRVEARGSQSRQAFEEFSRTVAGYVASVDPASPATHPNARLFSNRWPDNPGADEYLAKFAKLFLWGFFCRAQADDLTAFRFIKLLAEFAEIPSFDDERFAAVAPFVLRWPLALNMREEYAKERKEKLANLRRFNVGAKSAERVLRPLRGALGETVNSYIAMLGAGMPGIPYLPPLSASTLPEYRACAWELFIKEHGVDFENHSALKSIGPVVGSKNREGTITPGIRRDIIRDAWEGCFKTVAKQLAAQ